MNGKDFKKKPQFGARRKLIENNKYYDDDSIIAELFKEIIILEIIL